MIRMDFGFNGNTPGCRLFAGEKNLSTQELTEAKEEILAAKKLIQRMKLPLEDENNILDHLDQLYIEADRLYLSKAN